MANKYKLEILTVCAIVAFCMIFLYTGAMMKGAEFTGTDTIATAKISEMSGIPAEDVQPLIPQWVPPSGEIESCLFALQAAIGGMLIGGVFGFWIGQMKKV